jgi:acetyl-CoA acetyltransferase
MAMHETNFLHTVEAASSEQEPLPVAVLLPSRERRQPIQRVSDLGNSAYKALSRAFPRVNLTMLWTVAVMGLGYMSSLPPLTDAGSVRRWI